MTRAIYRASLRLIFRSVWIYAVTVPMLILAWVVSRLGRGTAIFTELFHQPFMIPFFLGQTIAVAAFVQAERARGLEEMAAALPHRAGAVVMGRAGALYTAWLGAGTLIYGLIFYRAVLRWHLQADLFPLLDWFLVMAVTLLFTTGVAYGIGSVMRRGFGAYLVLLLLFLAGSWPFNQVFGEFFQGLGGGPLATIDFTLSSYFPLTGVNLFPDLWALIFNRMHAAGVGLFWLAAVAWREGRRRREGGSGTKRAAVAAVAALGLVLVAFTGARALWADRVSLMQSEWRATSAKAATAPVGVPAPAVGAYRISLLMNPGGHGLEAEAAVRVDAVGELAAFTLNQTFAVASVTGPGGSEVPFARSGDLLVITAGGRTGTYTISYQGQVWQWRPDKWNGMRLAAHVAPESIVLPAGMGWYPLPGQQRLTYLGHKVGVDDGVVWHPAAPLELRVEGAGNLTIASNALGGAPVSSAWLIGTPYTPAEQGGVRFYTGQASKFGESRFAEQYQPQIEWTQRLVPLGRTPDLIEVPAALWAVRMELEAAPGFPGAMVVPPTFLMRRDNMRVENQILSLWWRDGRTDEESQVHDVLKYYMAELFEREVRHRDQVYITLTQVGFEVGTKTPQGQQLLAQLRRYKEEHGLEAAGRLLQSLRESPVPLTFKQVTAAVRGEAS